VGFPGGICDSINPVGVSNIVNSTNAQNCVSPGVIAIGSTCKSGEFLELIGNLEIFQSGNVCKY
jgi:hypothetical protein